MTSFKRDVFFVIISNKRCITMSNGLVDIFTSRRDFFDDCMYWSVNEEEYIDPNELVHNTTPSGYFTAKQVSSEDNTSQVIGGAFMFDSTRITLKTNDIMDGLIKKNDIVLFRGEIWRVEDVQKTPIKKSHQLSVIISYTFFIRLKQ